MALSDLSPLHLRREKIPMVGGMIGKASLDICDF